MSQNDLVYQKNPDLSGLKSLKRLGLSPSCNWFNPWIGRISF